MKKSFIVLTILSALLALYLIGCGGGGSNVISTTPATNSGTGSLSISGIVWPKDKSLGASNLAASVIFPTTTAINIDVVQTNGTAFNPPIHAVITSPATTGTISNIPIGTVQVRFSGVDAGGNILSSRYVPGVVISSTPASVTADLGVTIVNNTFVPKDIKISPGDVLYWGNADSTTHIVQFTTNARTFTMTLAPFGQTGYLQTPNPPFTDSDVSGPVQVVLYGSDITQPPYPNPGSVTVVVPNGQNYAQNTTWGLTALSPHNAVDGHSFLAVDKNGNFFVAMHNPQIPYPDSAGGVANQSTLSNASDLYIPGEKVLNLNNSLYTKHVERIEKYNSAGQHSSITFDTTSIDQIVGMAVAPDGSYLYVSDNQMPTGENLKSPQDYTNTIEDRVLKYDANSGGSPQDIIQPPHITPYYDTLAVNGGQYLDANFKGNLYFDGNFPQGLAVSPDQKFLFICDAHVNNIVNGAGTHHLFPSNITYEPMIHRVELQQYNNITGTNYTWTDSWSAINHTGWPYRAAYIGGNVLANAPTYPFSATYIPVDVAVSGDSANSTNGTVWFATWGNQYIQQITVSTAVPTYTTLLDSGRFDITGLDLRWSASNTASSDLYISCVNTGSGLVMNYNGVGGSASFQTILTGFITGWPGTITKNPVNTNLGEIKDISSASRGGGLLSIAVAPNVSGQLYVGDDYHRVSQFNRSSSGSTGTYSFNTAWRLLYEAFDFPVGIAYDNAGNNVYVTDRVNCRVLKYNSAGVYQTQWGIPPNPSDSLKPDFYDLGGVPMWTTDDGIVPPTAWTRYKFEEPTYANVPGLNNPPFPILSIGSSQAGLSVGAFNTVPTIPVQTAACNPGEFFMPQGIAVSPDGTAVYVVDWALNQTAAPNPGYFFGRVQKFDSVGTWKLQWYQSTNLGPFIAPKGIAVDKAGLVYLSWFAGVSGLVEQFNADGSASGKAFTAAPGAVSINRPEGVALDTTDPNYPAGILYVSDKYNHRIIIYDAGSAAGSLIGQVATTGGTGGSDAGQVRYPAGLAVDNTGYLYAVDAGNKRVEKWSPLRLGNGFLCIFGGAGNLLDPWGIAVSPDGTFAYVADSRDHRVVLYKSAPLATAKATKTK